MKMVFRPSNLRAGEPNAIPNTELIQKPFGYPPVSYNQRRVKETYQWKIHFKPVS